MRNRGHVSVSAGTYAALHTHSHDTGRSMSSIMEDLINGSTPPLDGLAKVGEASALNCAGCRRTTVHRLVSASEAELWRCEVCWLSRVEPRGER